MRSVSRAGDTLVRQGLAEQLQGLVYFPALYCYRHAVEFALKDVVYIWARAEGRRVKVIESHDLTVIWPRARQAQEEASLTATPRTSTTLNG